MIEDTELEISPYVISQIKSSYIVAEKRPSFRELEEVYGMPKSTINDIAIKENWEMQRNDYHSKIIQSAENTFKAKVAKERRKKLNSVNKIFKLGSERLLEQLEQKQYRITVKDINMLARLSEFLSGEVDTRQGHVFKLDKPLSEYTVDELLALKGRIIEGRAEVISEEEDEEQEVGFDEYEEIEDE